MDFELICYQHLLVRTKFYGSHIDFYSWNVTCEIIQSQNISVAFCNVGVQEKDHEE